MPIRFLLNGKPQEIEGADPHTTVLAWLRQQGLTASKEGCAEGECGACAVAWVRSNAAGQSTYQSVNSCLLLLAACDGQELWTAEGLGQTPQLHPVQEAMLAGGSQCGYCTPGFVVSLFAEYHRPQREGFDLEALGGNLCRCTGYRPIRDAALGLGQPLAQDPFQKRLDHAAPHFGSLDYRANQRRFLRPTSLGELFGLLQEHPQAKLIAGGTDVVVEVNLRHQRWDTLVSLEAIPELQTLSWTDKYLEIGAAVPLSHLEEALQGRLPLLEQLFPLYASRLLRHRATLGGNLVTASPIGDSSPALLALGARVRLSSSKSERVLSLAEFFRAFRQTALKSGEVLRSVLIPLPLPQIQRFYKVAKRGRDDISTVAMAIGLDVDDKGSIGQVRIGLGGVAPTPTRAFQTEAEIEGLPFNRSTLQLAARMIQSEFKPISDHRGSAEYRKAMLGRLLERFYQQTHEVIS